MMSNVLAVHGNGLRAPFARVFLFRLVFLTACWNFGKAGVVIYEEDIDIEEFPDVELSYTHPLRKNGMEGPIVAAHPINACLSISKPPDLNISLDWFVLISGNSCSFETKVLNAKTAGYSVAVIYTYRGKVESPSNRHNGRSHLFSNISAIVIKTEHGLRIKDNYLFTIDERFRVFIFPNNSFGIMTFLLIFAIVAGLFVVVMLVFAIIRFFQQSNSSQSGRLSARHLRQLQTSTFQKGDPYETCAICLEDYKDHDRLRILPCSHGYHVKCIDPWLTNSRPICPVCQQKVVLEGHNPSNTTLDSDSDERSETASLLQRGRVSQHGTFDAPMVLDFNRYDTPWNPASTGNGRQG